MTEADSEIMAIGQGWLDHPMKNGLQMFVDEQTKTVYNSRSLSRFLQQKYFYRQFLPKPDMTGEARHVWAKKLTLAHSVKEYLTILLTKEITRATMIIPDGPRWQQRARDDLFRLNRGKLPGVNPGLALTLEEVDNNVQWVENLLNTIDAYGIGKERSINQAYLKPEGRRMATFELQREVEERMKKQMGIDFSLFGAIGH